MPKQIHAGDKQEKPQPVFLPIEACSHSLISIGARPSLVNESIAHSTVTRSVPLHVFSSSERSPELNRTRLIWFQLQTLLKRLQHRVFADDYPRNLEHLASSFR